MNSGPFRLLLLVFTFAVIGSNAQKQDFSVVKDLRSDWNTQEKDIDETRAVYFSLNRDVYKGASLLVSSKEAFSIFINGRLVDDAKGGQVLLNLDSLAKIYSANLKVGVFCARGCKRLITQVAIPSSFASEDLPLERKGRYFLDFSILASIILLVYWVALLVTNARLTLDYINFIKLFSIQERDENILTSRVTSSVNLLFYAFASLLGAFMLMVIFHYAPQEFPIAYSSQGNTLAEVFLQWSKLAMGIFFLFLIKLTIIYIFSLLFGMTEVAPIQFFNYLRLFLFIFGMAGLTALIFFIFKTHGTSGYSGLLVTAAILLGLWKVVLFLKLIARVSFRVFHLFSYLCASEIIPFVILIKVVFF